MRTYPENSFPARSASLLPVQRFNIRGRYADLYCDEPGPYGGPRRSDPYTLRWEDTNELIQHRCVMGEVLNILHALLEG